MDGIGQFVARGQAAQQACDVVLSELEKQIKPLARAAQQVRTLRRQSEQSIKLAAGPMKSRTAQMYDRRIARGLCGKCGREPLQSKVEAGGSERLGVKCLKKHARYVAQRKK